MTFGVCAGVEEAEAVLAAGFDYIEVGASGFNGLEGTWEHSPHQGFPIPATNLFFDGRIKLFGPEKTEYRSYSERTIERAASLGVKTMVVGSGNSRRAPDGVNGDAAFVAIIAELQEIADRHGIKIAPESLNADETNVGVLLGPLARELSRVGAGFTADSYHVLREWDRAGRPGDLDALWAAEIPSLPTHVHLGPIDRTAPRANDPMLRSFARYIRKGLKYDGTVSLEVNRGSGFDLAHSNRVMRELFA